MANLETLELRISANAQSATEALKGLISSLQSLSDALIKPYADLRDFNEELLKLKRLGKIKFAIEGSQTLKSVNRTTEAIRKGKEETINWSKAIDRMLGIGAKPKSAAESWKTLAFAKEPVTQAQKTGTAFTPAHDEAEQIEKQNRDIAYQNRILQANAEAWSKSRTAAMLFMGVNGRGEQLKLGVDSMKAYYREAMESIGKIGEETTAKNMGITVDALRNRLAELKTAIESSGKSAKKATTEAQKGMKDVKNATGETTSVLSKLKTGFGSLTSGITKAFSRIKRIATTMLIRKAIRGLVASMKEGVNNVYEWSKATGGKFAQAMDTAKAKILTLKNSLGASISPIIQALIPLFNSLASAVINAANWINQFISLLSGKTSWTKAVEQAGDATDDLAESARGAGSAAKDALAAFDELNVIQSGGGGGGSGSAVSATEDYEGMFEEITRFDEKIRSITDFIKNNIESIKTVALGIGTAILAWKLGESFATVLPTLSTIFGYVATGAVIAITLQATWMLTSQYLDTGEEGWLFIDALTTAVGATAAFAIAKKLIGGKTGYYAAAITLALSAVVGVKALLDKTDVSAISQEGLLTSAENALKLGAAATFLSISTGAGVGTALSGGAVAALATFGVIIGIKATAGVIETKQITKDTIKADVISALSLGTAAGVLAAIGGAGAGIAIGGGALVAIATFGALIAIQALATIAVPDKNAIQWGDVDLTEKQINTFVQKKMFDVDPLVTVNLIADNISEGEVDRTEIRDAVTDMIGTLEVINLGLATDDDYNTIKEQITGKGGLIDKINEWINDTENLNKLVLKFTPKFVGETEEEQNQWYLDAFDGWETVKNHVKGLGEELAGLIVKGEGDQLEVLRPERVNEILSEINRISEIVAGSDASVEAMIDFNIGLTDLNEDDFGGAVKLFDAYKEQIGQAAKELEETAYANQLRMVESFKLMLELDPNNAELQAKLKEAEDAAKEMYEHLGESIDDDIKEMSQSGTEELKKWFDKHMETFQQRAKEVDWGDLSETWAGDVTSMVASVLNMSSDEIATMELVGYDQWDLMAESSKEALLKALKAEFGSEEALKKIKEAFPDIKAGEMISISGFDDMTSEGKLRFLNALKETFGSEEALAAAKEAGIDISALVAEGLGSNDKDIQDAAKKLNDLITEEVDDKTHKTTAELTYDSDKTKKTATGMATVVTGKNPKMTAALTYVSSTAKTTRDKLAKYVTDKKPKMVGTLAYSGTVAKKTSSDLAGYVSNKRPQMTGSINYSASDAKAKANSMASTITSVHPTMTSFAGFVTGAMTGLKSQVESLHPTMNVNASVDSSPTSSIVTGFKRAIKLAFGAFGMTVQPKANGGLVRSGDLFLANENGSSEMIGRFGNHTAVANQEQMVEAMARGVEYANAEQNRLLREQNTLLRGILAKDSSVRIGASSALGRVARQSLDMYSSVVGG